MPYDPRFPSDPRFQDPFEHVLIPAGGRQPRNNEDMIYNLKLALQQINDLERRIQAEMSFPSYAFWQLESLFQKTYPISIFHKKQ